MEVMISFLLFLIDPVTNILHRYFFGTPDLVLGNSELISVFVHIQLCFLWLMPKEQTKVFRQFVHFITSLLVISFILYSVYHNNTLTVKFQSSCRKHDVFGRFLRSTNQFGQHSVNFHDTFRYNKIGFTQLVVFSYINSNSE